MNVIPEYPISIGMVQSNQIIFFLLENSLKSQNYDENYTSGVLLSASISLSTWYTSFIIRIKIFVEIKREYNEVSISIWFYGDAMAWECFLHYFSLCEGNPPVTGGIPSQRARNVELSYLFLLA